MRLKTLELQGFKSFPDRTVLNFENGATVIVGPNGSGKSNISDAMRWVLGEISSKSIRSTKMEDVIFGGADSRRPMGYAEVSVTFDNSPDSPGAHLDSPYDEVTVTRRYYRAGESEYFINRKPVRLKDIYELFMNTGVGREGYSIIGQGKIAEIISRKSDERRSIFEDAAGIAKYRYKKQEAERRLAATEDNMVRINDILSELEGRVGPLEKESARAKKYLEIFEEKKRADVSLWLYDTEDIRVKIEQAESNFKLSAHELEMAEDDLASLELQNDKLYEASQQNKLVSEQLITKIREQIDDNHKIDSELKVAENNIAHCNSLIESDRFSADALEHNRAAAEAEKTKREERASELKNDLEDTYVKYEELGENKKRLEEKLLTMSAELEDKLEIIESLKSEQTEIRVRMSVIENSRRNDDDKNRSIETEIENYEKITKDLAEELSAAEKTVDEYSSAAEKVNAEIAEFDKKTESLFEKKNELQNKIGEFRASAGALEQRIDALRRMEEHFEGYTGSVRFVMQAYEEGGITTASGEKCRTIYGPVSKLISVGREYITAIETALGANIQNIVVEDEECAKAAIYALKRAGAGRATFYPLTSMKWQGGSRELDEAKKYAGFVGTADELVSCDAKFSNIIKSLLGRTAVFDNIDNAAAMAKAQGYKIRAVTLDGQQINVGGSFTGGSAKRDSGILSRSADIEKFGAQLSKIEKELSGLENERKDVEKEYESAVSGKKSAEDRKSLFDTMLGAERARYDALKAKLDANVTLTDKLKEDCKGLLELRTKYESEISELEKKDGALTAKTGEIEEYRRELEIKRNGMSDEAEALSEKITEMYIKLSEIRKDIDSEEQMIESVIDRIKGYEAENGEREARLSELRARISAYEAEIKENRAKAEKGEAELSRLNSERASVEEGGFEFEKKLNELRAKIREKTNGKELIFREHSKNETKLTNLQSEQDKLATKLWEDYELTRAGAVELGYPEVTRENRAEVAAKQTECKNRLRGFGNVNVGAIEEYEEVKTRYDYMTGQINDLNGAKTDLLGIIDKLEVEMKASFMDSFNKINENFGRVFREFFGGGNAEISLTDPEDILGSGIEIKAAPPGKIIKNLIQLSGGEQAFVAIALLFAILKTNPSPFCIFDEIEAALDEVNVTRFAEYIKRYSDGTQFIIITHRRGTMEIADTLYGVTMPERGISKILSLNVGDIEKYKGDSWDGIF